MVVSAAFGLGGLGFGAGLVLGLQALLAGDFVRPFL